MNANPYAFLDDAPLEERRARAVEMRRTLPPEMARARSARSTRRRLKTSQRESWPVVRDADELHDALLTLVWVPVEEGASWVVFLPRLIEEGRIVELSASGEGRAVQGWVAAENRDAG